MSPANKPNPWKSFKPIGDLRLARGEESEGGWGTLLLLNLLGAVVGGFLFMSYFGQFILEVQIEAPLQESPGAVAWNPIGLAFGGIGAFIGAITVTVLWFQGGKASVRK